MDNGCPKCEKEITKKQIERVLPTLSYREREIIKLRFGIGDGYTYTLEEVGRIFKVTRERVRQVEAKAIRKIKSSIELCLGCQLEQAEATMLQAMNQLEEIKQKIAKEKESVQTDRADIG